MYRLLFTLFQKQYGMTTNLHSISIALDGDNKLKINVKTLGR